MDTKLFRRWQAALLALSWMFTASSATAAVSVTVNSNVAIATIALPDVNPSYNATVTITFDDSVVNLTPGSLNLTAELVDPNNFSGLPARVSIDPNFPVLVSVEPPAFLFTNSFEPGQVGNGNLDFLNTYEFEFHSDEHLQCSSAASTYRLYKAPHGSNVFADVTDDLFTGSVRARGRGGAFSRFVIARDGRGILLVTLQKLTDVTTRLLASGINGTLLTSLTGLLTQVGLNIATLNIGGAIANLDAFIADVAGNGIANEWNAVDLGLNPSPNDAGELLSLAQTLRFTLTLLNGTAPVCQAPPA